MVAWFVRALSSFSVDGAQYVLKVFTKTKDILSKRVEFSVTKIYFMCGPHVAFATHLCKGS